MTRGWETRPEKRRQGKWKGDRRKRTLGADHRLMEGGKWTQHEMRGDKRRDDEREGQENKEKERKDELIREEEMREEDCMKDESTKN